MENSKGGLQLANLKYFRICNNLLQKDIAEYLGVTTSFISRIESGHNKLPTEHLAKLLENDMGWQTEYLYPSPGQRMEINNGTKNVGNSFENAIHSTVNNYQGYSDEEVDSIVTQRLALKELECKKLLEKIEDLLDENAFLKSTIEWFKEQYGTPKEKKSDEVESQSQEN